MDKNQDKPGIRKGDAFVQMDPHPLVYMEVNEVEGCTDSMEFCIVTWYTFNEKGLNVQRRFPMAARNGIFSNFEPISRNLLKEAKCLLRQYDADVKLLTVKAEANGFNVSWSESEGATSYVVYRRELNTRTNKFTSWKAMVTLDSENATWLDTSAKKGVTYRYTVRAVNGNYKSAYSAGSSVKR